MDRPAAILCTAPRTETGAFEVLRHLLRAWDRRAAADPLVVAPATSSIAAFAREFGFPLASFDTTRDSLLPNLRWTLRRSTLSALADCAVIHAWHTRAFELAWLLGKRLGKPTCGTVHDGPWCRAHSPARRLLMRLAGSRLGRLVCVSRATHEAWAHVCSADRLTVVLNGLADLPVPARAGPRAITIGFLGMYTAWKGFDVMARWIRAWTDAPVRWLLYGEPAADSVEAARDLVTDCGGSVVLRGMQPQSIIFSEIDVLAHASTQFDPFPTVLLEAAWAGIPAVASDLGGSAEIIEPGVTGMLFDPSRPDQGLQHLKSLVADAALRAEMGAAARRRFERDFKADRMSAEYAALWRNLAAGRA